ncbi:MAG: hypothetical protein LBB63_04300 [Holosporaceae bacterium]|nr:hypothetical protein [Holosporaceae bacterium]
MKKVILGFAMTALVASVQVDTVEGLSKIQLSTYTKKPLVPNKSVERIGQEIKTLIEVVSYFKYFNDTAFSQKNGLKDFSGTIVKDIYNYYRNGDDVSISRLHGLALAGLSQALLDVSPYAKAIIDALTDVLKSDYGSVKDKKFSSGVVNFERAVAMLENVLQLAVDRYIGDVNYIIKQAKALKSNTRRVDLSKSKCLTYLDSQGFGQLLSAAHEALQKCEELKLLNDGSSDVERLAKGFKRLTVFLNALYGLCDILMEHASVIRHDLADSSGRSSTDYSKLESMMKKRGNEILFSTTTGSTASSLNGKVAFAKASGLANSSSTQNRRQDSDTDYLLDYNEFFGSKSQSSIRKNDGDRLDDYYDKKDDRSSRNQLQRTNSQSRLSESNVSRQNSLRSSDGNLSRGDSSSQLSRSNSSLSESSLPLNRSGSSFASESNNLSRQGSSSRLNQSASSRSSEGSRSGSVRGGGPYSDDNFQKFRDDNASSRSRLERAASSPYTDITKFSNNIKR